MKVMIGTSRRRQTSNSLSVCASMPLAASITMTALNRPRSACGRCPREKSSWPGVSSRLKVQPPYSKVITEVVTEMPRCCSIFIQSERARRRSPARLDLAGEMDRAAEQQQLLGQRRLAGVRVRDDREGAAARGGLRHRRWGAIAQGRAPCAGETERRWRGDRSTASGAEGRAARFGERRSSVRLDRRERDSRFLRGGKECRRLRPPAKLDRPDGQTVLNSRTTGG